MADKIPKLSGMIGKGRRRSSSLQIDQMLLQSRHRIKYAYDHDARHSSFGMSNAYCPWSLCTEDATKSHAHLHHPGRESCEWDRCDKIEFHLHKYKPPPLDPPEYVDPTERYKSVENAMKDVMGIQREEESLVKNIYVQLDRERKAEEAEKERKARRIEDAERAGEAAKREFEEATAARRARRAEDHRRKEIDEALERNRIQRRTARARMTLEAESENEIERTFAQAGVSPTLTQVMMDAQLGVFHQQPTRDEVIESNLTATGSGTEQRNPVSLGKRKRADSGVSQTSSLTDFDAAELDSLIQEETPWNAIIVTSDVTMPDGNSNPQSWTSDLTSYNRDELDAIFAGAEVVVQEPRPLPYDLFSLTPPGSPQEPSSSDADPEVVAGPSSDHHNTPPTSADDDAEPLNAFNLGHIPPPPPRPPRLSEREAAEKAVMEEQLARRRQIQWVLKDPQYLRKQVRKWEEINIYEDPEDGRDGEGGGGPDGRSPSVG